MELLDREIKPRDRNAIRRELAEVRAAHPEGLLVAEEVVRHAESSSSAMHGMFEWDDGKAGREWRLHQARALIRTVEVTMPNDKEERSLPKYVSLGSDRKRPGGGYRETSEVLGSKELLAELEATAKRDIDGVLARYEMLKELCAKVRQAANIGGASEARPRARGDRRRQQQASGR